MQSKDDNKISFGISFESDSSYDDGNYQNFYGKVDNISTRVAKIEVYVQQNTLTLQELKSAKDKLLMDADLIKTDIAKQKKVSSMLEQAMTRLLDASGKYITDDTLKANFVSYKTASIALISLIGLIAAGFYSVFTFDPVREALANYFLK